MAKLNEIAADMEIEAKRRGWSIRTLGRGLELRLNWVGGTKTLTLSRPAQPPGEQEITICRGVFDIPAEADRNDGENAVTLRWAS